MSYSALIQQDNPTSFWSLDEKSGTIASNDGFIVTANGVRGYDGIYSNSINSSNLKSVLPIVYGGKTSILSTSGTIKIPDLKKMAIPDCKNSSSIEFWIKVPATSSSNETIILQKKSGVKVSLLNDNIVFSIGKNSLNSQTIKYSVSVQIDTVNKPIHIIASYSPQEISLIVNGVQKIKKIYNPEYIFAATSDSADNYFIFGLGDQSTDVSFLQLDSIALYSYVLTRNQALRHYAYGVGYNIPTKTIDSSNGVYYNFSMDSHQSINKYEYGGANPWSITQSNNCVINNGSLTIKSKNEPKTYFIDGYGSENDRQSYFGDENTYAFDSKSYLSIDDVGSILPIINSGWMFSFKKIGTTIPTDTNETLFLLKSKDTNNFIEFVLTSSGLKVYINSSTYSTSIGPNLFSQIDTSFYVGFYIVDSSTVNVIYIPNDSSKETIVTTISLENKLSFGQTNLRIGSTDSWQSMSNAETVSGIATKTTTQKLMKVVGIHKDNSSLYFDKNSLESSSFIHYYTATPNYYEKRFKISSYATARIDIPLQTLAEPNKSYPGACRLEIGSPYLNNNVLSYVTGTTNTTVNGITKTTHFKEKQEFKDRVITDTDWLNKNTISLIQSGENRVDLLQFDFILKTDDLIDQPANIDYFRLFSYPVIEEGADKYLTCNASPGGNAIKIYYRNNEYAVPDLQEYPFFYNGNKSGLRIKNSYAKIIQDYAFPSKINNIVSASVNGSFLNYVLEKNNFNHGDKVIVSGVYNDDGSISSNWNFLTQVPVYVPSALSNRWNRISTTTWTTGVNYSINTRAYYGGTAGTKGIYKKTYAGSDNTTPPPSSELWEIQYTGTSTTWNQDLKYNALDIVKYSVDNYYYVCENIRAQGDDTIILPKVSGETFINYPTNEEYQGNMTIASGIQTISFMAYIPSTTTSLNLIKAGTSQLSLSGTTLSLSGAKIYVGGIENSTIKPNSWNSISIVFNYPQIISGEKSIEIIIGDQNSTTQEFYIDQLSIFDKKFTDNNVRNLYNLFSGDINDSYKVYSDGPTLIDNNLNKTINENTQVCYIIKDTDTEDYGNKIYTELIGKTADYTWSLSYKNTENTTDQTTLVDRIFTKGTGKKTIYVNSTSGIIAGSILKQQINDNIYTVASVVNDDIVKKPSVAVAKNNKNFVVITFANNTNFDLLEPGDLVASSNKAIHAGAKISSINSSENKIKIITGKNKKIVTKQIPITEKIIFKKAAQTITFDKDIPSSYKQNDKIIFDNATLKSNLIINNKIKIENNYIKNEDYILLLPSDKINAKLFKVDGDVDSENYNANKIVKINFKYIRKFDSHPNDDPYGNWVFYDIDDNNDESSAIFNSINNERAFKWTSTGWKSFASFADDRVKSYLISINEQ